MVFQASAARVFLRFPKVSRHPSCMDHAILHGKPFGIPLVTMLLFYQVATRLSLTTCQQDVFATGLVS